MGDGEGRNGAAFSNEEKVCKFMKATGVGDVRGGRWGKGTGRERQTCGHG